MRGWLDSNPRLATSRGNVSFRPITLSKWSDHPDTVKQLGGEGPVLDDLEWDVKVYLAMGDLKAAYADAEQCYLAVRRRASYISMRTDELEETEALKATILTALKQAESEK